MTFQYTSTLTYNLAFGLAKAATNYFAGTSGTTTAANH